MKQTTAAVLMLAICAAITAFTKSIKELCDKLTFKGLIYLQRHILSTGSI